MRYLEPIGSYGEKYVFGLFLLYQHQNAHLVQPSVLVHRCDDNPGYVQWPIDGFMSLDEAVSMLRTVNGTADIMWLCATTVFCDGCPTCETLQEEWQ